MSRVYRNPEEPEESEEVAECTRCSEPATCETCENCDDHCNCWVCRYCRGNRRSGRHTQDDPQCSRCELCQDHCECAHCDRCGDPVDSTCSECYRCEDCCSCTRCARCGDISDAICNECDRCEDCCACSSGWKNAGCMVAAPEDQYTKHVTHTGDKSHPLRLCGVELETSYFNADWCPELAAVIRKWGGGVVEDTSVAGPEIVTPPAEGERFRMMLKQILGVTYRASAQVDSSCGIHVHVDGSGFGPLEFRRLFLIYATVEEGIYRIVSPSRRQGTYARPCGNMFLSIVRSSLRDRPRGPKNELVALPPHKAMRYERLDIYDFPRYVRQRAARGGSRQLAFFFAKELMEVPVTAYRYHFRTKKSGRTGKLVEDKHAFKYDKARYFGLNIHSWYYRGSFEFRHHQGSLNFDKITNWVSLVSFLVDCADKWTDQQLVDWLPQGANLLNPDAEYDTSIDPHDSFAALLSLAPTKEVQQWMLEREAHFHPGDRYRGGIPSLMPRPNPRRK